MIPFLYRRRSSLGAKHDFVSAYTRASGLCLTPKPLRSEYIRVGRRKSFIDLGAEKAVIGAEKEGLKIAVEIKSFLGASDLDEFEDALGQFIIYFNALEEKDPDRHLYMAMPGDFYERFFEDGFSGN